MPYLLHRQNAELETLNADIQTEKKQLQQRNTHLTERLEAVAQSSTPGQGINAETPLDLMLGLLQKLVMVNCLLLLLVTARPSIMRKQACMHQLGTVWLSCHTLTCTKPSAPETCCIMSLQLLSVLMCACAAVLQDECCALTVA